MSYYDLDAILTDSQKIPCTFELDVPGLGYLDGNAGGTIKKGTKVDLPIWMATVLSNTSNTGGPNLVTLDYPLPLSPRVINALKADPRTVDLRAQAPHFYALAARVLEHFEDDDLSDVLLATFKARAAEIADHAHNARGALGDGAEFLRGLDESERALFKAAHEGSKGVRAWRDGVRKNS